VTTDSATPRSWSRTPPSACQAGTVGLARLDEIADGDAAPEAVIDRVRGSLQARIGRTRALVDKTSPPEPDGLTERELTERELRRDLITAENAELAWLYRNGTRDDQR
jgi:hypothetical protein